jgi:hypothetical protein
MEDFKLEINNTTIATILDSVPGEHPSIQHFPIVVLKDDQVPRIAEAVVRALVSVPPLYQIEDGAISLVDFKMQPGALIPIQAPGNADLKRELEKKIMSRIFSDGGELYFRPNDCGESDCENPECDGIHDSDVVEWFEQWSQL